MKSQDINRIGKHSNFFAKELYPNFEENKFRAFPIVVGSLALKYIICELFGLKLIINQQFSLPKR